MGHLRHLRGPRRDRRHLGPVPLPGHPVRLRHVHARLLVPAVGRREVDRRRRLDPAVHQGHRRARPASTSTSGSTTGSSGADWSTEDGPLDTSPPSGPTPARRSSSPAASCSRAAATTATTTATSPTSPAWTASAAPIVHPQAWPDDLDYAGKRVVVIGSGATAVTLDPVDGRDGRRT